MFKNKDTIKLNSIKRNCKSIYTLYMNKNYTLYMNKNYVNNN